MPIIVVPINYLAILVTALASFLFSGLWYSPLLFAKKWEKLNKMKMGEGRSFPKLMVISFVCCVITAFVLREVIIFSTATTVLDGIVMGFLVWLGFFAVTVLLGTVLWENKPFAFYAINAGYWLINLVLMSVILTLMQ